MAISVTDVTKSFDGNAALNGVSLSIDDGKFVALLGPSGSGKTTLLRIIAGLAYAEEGEVAFDRETVTHVPVQKRNIGFVFQNYALFRHQTVAENIAFGLKAMPRRERPSPGEIAERVERLLELVRLQGLGERYPAQLSGGQRQRVALARALARKPRFLLLDEPFGALDAKVRQELRVALREIHDTLGLTSIFVTHDREEAFALADQVAILNSGRVEQYAPPASIAAQPASEFVRDFLS